ncbi:MAG TPA: SDR family oxidoreductase [Roseiflexaceae bacterium]|nr:SDR family oxidoreductase [Roseiflexaceae bacterium]
MNLLILGGTVFLGRYLVESALARGHQVTLFNRGQHNPDLFPEVEKLRGDRDGGLNALQGRRWDAVIDTCGYVPRIVRDSAELLAGAVEHYTFISSISVYARLDRLGMDEDSPLGTLEDETVEQVTGETYGPLKVLCERAAERAMPGRALVIRPGLIVGPHDISDRFPYWPRRIARGGEVLAPGRPESLTQIIDVRDLADWTVAMVERRATGAYNATGPERPLTMGELLETCRAVVGDDARLTWVDEAFLLEQGVAPWSEVPLWVPESPDTVGFSAVDCRRAIDAGLTFRPLEDIIQATLDWDRSRPADTKHRAGLAAEREAEVLAAWRARQQDSGSADHG